MRVRIEIDLVLRADSVADARAVADAVLDAGVFQDAIGEFATDEDYDIGVESALIDDAYQLVPIPKE